jgi:hypothetical protein
MTRGRKPGVQPADKVFIRPGALPAPDDLPDAARAQRGEVMRSTPEQQWRPGDLPLLAVFCRTHELAREAATRLEEDGQLVDGKPSPWALLTIADGARGLATSDGLVTVPSKARAEVGLGRTRYSRALADMEAAGLVEVQRTPGTEGKPSGRATRVRLLVDLGLPARRGLL